MKTLIRYSLRIGLSALAAGAAPAFEGVAPPGDHRSTEGSSAFPAPISRIGEHSPHRPRALPASYELFPPGQNGNTGFNYLVTNGGGCQATVIGQKGTDKVTCFALSATHCFAPPGTPRPGVADPETGSVVVDNVNIKNQLGNLSDVKVFLNASYFEKASTVASGSRYLPLTGADFSPTDGTFGLEQIAKDTAVFSFDCTREKDKYQVQTLCAGPETMKQDARLRFNKVMSKVSHPETKVAKQEATRVHAPQTTPPVIPGDSGGGLYNEAGQLCGALSAISNPSPEGEVVFAADIAHVRKVLEKNGVAPGGPGPGPGPGDPKQPDAPEKNEPRKDDPRKNEPKPEAPKPEAPRPEGAPKQDGLFSH